MTCGIKLTYEFVKEFFVNQGCELLESEYKNARTHLRYKCSCGNRSKIVFDSFRRGNRCRQCGNRKVANHPSQKKGLTQEDIISTYQKRGCELLDTYINSATPMRYRCSCGTIAMMSWNNFRKGKKCRQCGINRRSGEHHYEWREDREAAHLEYIFRQRCYKLLGMSLKATGRVKNGRTAALLGYGHQALKEHITSHPNYELVKNEKWHIDHIFPIKAFVDHKIIDLALINCLDNLRPLLGSENCSKNGIYNVVEFRNWLTKKGVLWNVM